MGEGGQRCFFGGTYIKDDTITACIYFNGKVLSEFPHIKVVMYLSGNNSIPNLEVGFM